MIFWRSKAGRVVLRGTLYMLTSRLTLCEYAFSINSNSNYCNTRAMAHSIQSHRFHNLMPGFSNSAHRALVTSLHVAVARTCP